MPNLIMTESILSKKRYHVVQFLEKPSDYVRKYVCVPNVWISLRKPTDTKVYVSYPNDEKPTVTRRRVRTRAALDETWSIYPAVVKFGSNNYNDACNYALFEPVFQLSDEEDSNTQGMRLRSTRKPPSNSKTDEPKLTAKLYENSQKPTIKMLTKLPIQSKPKKDRNRKNTRLEEAAKSTSAFENNASTASGSKREQSITFRDDQLIQSDKTETTAAIFNSGKSINQSTDPQPSMTKPERSNTRQSTATASKFSGEKQPSPVRQDCEHEPSTPLLDVDEPSGVINSDQEIQSESITEHLSSSQISLHTSRQPETVQETQISVRCLDNPLLEPPTPEISVTQSKDINGHSQKTNLHSNTIAAETIALKPPSTTNQFSESFQHTQLPTVSRNSFLNSLHLQEIPLRRQTELTHVSQMPHLHDITSDIPSTSQNLLKFRSGKPKPVSKKNHLENIVRTIKKVKSVSTNERKPSSVERHAPLNTQNHLQDVPQVTGIYAGNLIDGNGIDQRSILRGIANSSQKVSGEPEMLVRGSNEMNRINNHGSFHQNIAQKTFSAQNVSNIDNHHHRFSQQSDERNNYPIQVDYLQHISRVQDNNMHRRPNRVQIINQRAFAAHDRPNPATQHSDTLPRSHQDQPFYQYHVQREPLRHELLGRCTETNHTDHGNHPHNIGVGVFAVQNPSNVSNQFHRGFELTQQRQLPPNYQRSQRDPRLTETRVDISMKSNSKSQSHGLQEVTKRTPPGLTIASNSMGQAPLNAHKHSLLEDPRTQAFLIRRSTEQNNIDVADVSRNITADTSLFVHNGKVPPTCSCHQLHEIQLTPVRQNHVYQNQRKQKLLVDQSTETNFTMKRIYCKDDIIRSPSSPRLVDSACQTDETLIEEPLSTYYQEVVSDREMSTEDAPVEIVNDYNCRGDQVRFVQRELSPSGDIDSTPYVDASVTPAHTHRLTARGGAAESTSTSMQQVDTCFRSTTMPRIYVEKGSKTGEVDEDAMKKVLDKTWKSAQKCGVKPTTLESSLPKFPKKTAAENEDNIPERVFCSEFTSNQVFTIEEETLLNTYITECSKMHYGLTIVLVKKLAYEFSKANQLHYSPSWDHNKMASNEWLDSFRRRHTHLSLRKPENTSAVGSYGFNKTAVNNFFQNLEKVLIKYKFTADRIYNYDELGISTVAAKNQQEIGELVSAERGITFGGIISAIGNTVPPLFVFPEVHFKDHFITGAPECSLGVATKNGSINSSIFLKVLKHIKKVVSCSKDNPMLLLVNNHESHVTIEAVDYARDNGIVYLSFPPHTKHRLQPLDVGVFGPFKAKLKTVFNDWHVNNPGKTLNIHNIPKLAKIAYFESFNSKNITNAFEKTGIWPFNKFAFSDDDFAPMQVYHSDSTLTPDANVEEMDQHRGPPRSPHASHSLLPQPAELVQEHDSSPDVNVPEEISAEIELTQQDQPLTMTSAPSSSSLLSPASESTCSSVIGLVTPEIIGPYPKVNRNASKKLKKGKLLGKSRIYTDTPERNKLEEIEKGKKIKTQEDEKKQRTTEMECELYQLLSDSDMIPKPKRQKKSTKTHKPKRQKKTVCADVSEFINNFTYKRDTPVLSEDMKEGTFILVKFDTKTIIEFYVAQVVTKCNPTKYKVSYLIGLPLVGMCEYWEFIFPDIKNERIVDITDVVCILPQPKSGTTPRTSNRYNFGKYITSYTVWRSNFKS